MTLKVIYLDLFAKPPVHVFILDFPSKHGIKSKPDEISTLGLSDILFPERHSDFVKSTHLNAKLLIS